MTDTTTEAPSPYQWYWDQLAGKAVAVDHNTPMSGCYRSQYKDKQTGEITLNAYVYWYVDDQLYCLRNGKLMDEQRARETWPYVALKAISQEMVDAFMETGRWPDESEASHADRQVMKSTDDNAPDPTSIAGLTARLTALEAEAKTLLNAGAAKDKPTADRAADLANTIAGLATTMEAKRVAEKQPHLDAGRAVDRTWQPLVARADAAKGNLKVKVVNPWLTAENKRISEETAAKQAELLRTAEEARRNNAPPPDVVTAPIVPPKPVTAGSFGRRVHSQAQWSGLIEDRLKFLAHCKDHPYITEALEKIAAQYAKGERPEVPGLSYHEGSRAV